MEIRAAGQVREALGRRRPDLARGGPDLGSLGPGGGDEREGRRADVAAADSSEAVVGHVWVVDFVRCAREGKVRVRPRISGGLHIYIGRGS